MMTEKKSLRQLEPETYSVWRSMKQRCSRPDTPAYRGRGITICDRWRESFADFFKDMGPRPGDMSLDRIDVDGPYEKENCRWADIKTQLRNRSSSRRISFRGEVLSIATIAEQHGIPYATFRGRLNAGWEAERAVSVPVGGSRNRQEFKKVAKPSARMVDFSGVKIGSLAVEGVAFRKGPKTYWSCLCDCGHRLPVRGDSLSKRKEGTCWRCRDRKTHGMSGSTEYKIWSKMKKRCLNPKDAAYFRYGARGVTVDERWIGSFEKFFADVGSRPSRNHSLDRIDVEKGYSPENCRWATSQEQSRNRRNTVYVAVGDKKICAEEFARIHGINSHLFRERLRNGYSPEDSVVRYLPRKRGLFCRKGHRFDRIWAGQQCCSVCQGAAGQRKRAKKKAARLAALAAA